MRLPAAGLVRMLPSLLARRFDPAAAQDLDAEFELRVGEEPLSVRVRDGRCSVHRGAPSAAGARVQISARDLISLALGEVGWPQLLSAGRMRLAGDPFLAMRFPPLFRLTASPGEARARHH